MVTDLSPVLPDTDTVYRAGIVLALLASAVFLWRIERPRGRFGDRLRSRFLFGVPWGTLISAVGIIAFYLFVQGGLEAWYNPVTLAFSAWSYLYPLGWLTSSFAHAGPGHLRGNLIGTLLFAPLAEYYWGHFVTRRGSQSFSSWRTNPFMRAFIVFPIAVVAVGLLTSLFAWGPVIGFSGVVFAFAGFALVRYPIAVIVAAVARGVVNLLYQAYQSPTITAEAGTSFSRPWWSQIAVQGHALGLLLGVFLGVILVHQRDDRPPATRLWLGALLFPTSLSLWALYWFRGEGEYVLYRALGVVFVFAIAALITAAVRATDRSFAGEMTRRQAAVIVLAAPLLLMAFVAVPVNLTTVADPGPPGDGPAVSVQDYNVTYAEDVQNEMVFVADGEFFGESTQVNTSGVIVTSERRTLWIQRVSKSELAHSGRATVRVGGVDWRETVHVKRSGWRVDGGDRAYQVRMRPEDGDWIHAFESPSATADLRLEGRNISIIPDDGVFYLSVERDNATVTVPMPDDGQRRTVAGVTFEREDGELIASIDETRVKVASKETYN